MGTPRGRVHQDRNTRRYSCTDYTQCLSTIVRTAVQRGPWNRYRFSPSCGQDERNRAGRGRAGLVCRAPLGPRRPHSPPARLSPAPYPSPARSAAARAPRVSATRSRADNAYTDILFLKHTMATKTLTTSTLVSCQPQPWPILAQSKRCPICCLENWARVRARRA